MEAFCKAVEVFLRGQQQTPEGAETIKIFQQAMDDLQERFAARLIKDCYGGQQPAKQTGRAGFSALVAAAYTAAYSIADGSAYHEQHHKTLPVACTLCNLALNDAGKRIRVRDKTVFITMDAGKIGAYFCERCSKLWMLTQALFQFPTWAQMRLEEAAGGTGKSMQEIAGPIYSAPKSRTSDALKIPVSKWKHDVQNFDETTTPFVKAAVASRVALDYLLKFVDLQSGDAAAPKRRRTKTSAATALEGGGGGDD
jgi:hypothetical protein